MPQQGQPQSQTMEIPKRFPLVVRPENRDTATTKDARLVNAYMEKTVHEDTQETEYHIYERIGLTQSSQPSGGAATGAGTYNWLGNIYSIFGNKLYKNTTAVTGTVDTSNGVYRFSQCLGATPKLQLGNGVKAYNYDDANGLVLINDGDFPTTFRKGWGYLDGTTYVLRPTAQIVGDDINDPVNWDPLNTLTAQVEPDQGIALSKQLVYIVAFKQWTTEIFYDAGNATGSPLGAVQGAKVGHGCVSQDSVQDVDGALMYLATARNAGKYIVSIEALKAEIVSTKAIERLLNAWDVTNIYSWAIKQDGHKFYGLTSTVSNMTLVYDVTERMWAQWTDSSGNYFPIVSATFSSTYGNILQHESNGKLYLGDTSYITDDGSTIQVDIYTPNFDGGTKRRKTLSKLFFVGDKKVGTELQVRCNDFDYDSTKWTNFRTVDMSVDNPYLDDCGTFVRRAYNIRYNKPYTRMPRLKALDMQIALGTL